MALLFMDSFDHYATADLLEKWSSKTETGGVVTIGTTNGRRSGPGLRCAVTTSTASSTVVLKTLAPADATTVAGFSFVTDTTPGTNGTAIFRVQDGSGVQWSLLLLSDFKLRITRGGVAGTTLATSPGAAVALTVAAFIEVKVLISATVGTVEVRVNGVPVIGPLTGQNTQGSATSTWTLLVPGASLPSSGNPGSQTLDYDDLYVLDGSGAAPLNDFLGDCRVDARVPTGAGATTGWTPSAAPNWSCVDDVAPNDDTDYVSAAASGVTDTYAMQDAPVAGGTIYGVQLLWNVKKLDAGTCSVAPVIRQGSTDLPGTAQDPTTSYAYQSQVYGTNPHTSAAWTETDFNADEFGLARTA